MPERLRALILEDEWAARNFLVELVENSELAHVGAAAADVETASAALRGTPTPFDVAFVDVHLVGDPSSEVAGLHWIAEVVRSANPPRIIITTASKEHAIRAFELGATDYLLKPFTLERVKNALGRVTALGRRAPDPAPPRLAARSGRAIVFLRRDEAVAFEADGRLCFVHTGAGRYDIDLSLTALEAVLGDGWLRPHRGWLVALGAVRRIERDGGETTLIVGEEELAVPVARERATAVRDRLLAHSVGLRRDDG